MFLVSQGRLQCLPRVVLGIHHSIMLRKQLFHWSIDWSISWHKIESQSVDSISWQAFWKSACAYLQILRFSEWVCLVLVFHFMSKSSPKWSELASGDMTEQLRSSVGVERKVRSIREVDPFGLTCVWWYYLFQALGKMNTECQIICEKGDGEA